MFHYSPVEEFSYWAAPWYLLSETQVRKTPCRSSPHASCRSSFLFYFRGCLPWHGQSWHKDILSCLLKWNHFHLTVECQSRRWKLQNSRWSKLSNKSVNPFSDKVMLVSAVLMFWGFCGIAEVCLSFRYKCNHYFCTPKLQSMNVTNSLFLYAVETLLVHVLVSQWAVLSH